MGVEPTTRLAKSRINGFEGHEDHRTPFASRVSKSVRIRGLLDVFNSVRFRNRLGCYCGAISDAADGLMQVGDGQVRVTLGHGEALVSK